MRNTPSLKVTRLHPLFCAEVSGIDPRAVGEGTSDERTE